jgi:hypothetical protein
MAIVFEYRLDPMRSEIQLIEQINKRNNEVETTIRLRALAELSELLDTESLLSVLDFIVKHGHEGPHSRL